MIVTRVLLVALLINIFAVCAGAEEEETSEAYWDYGIGLGAVHYEQYPAADQFSDLVVPAPTFQYRGKILRADDREGAHLYLLKGADLTLEVSGVGYPALESSNNRAREGMDNLPWMIALGPQLVSRHFPGFEIGLGVYQVVTTDFDMTRFNGGIFEAQIKYIHQYEWMDSQGKLTASIKWGTAELQELYYSVPEDKATAMRPSFQAHDGMLSQDITYHQNFKVGRLSWVAGASVGFYGQAVNRESPLHKSDVNLTGFAGINYVLGESKKPAVPQEDTSGLINRIKQQRDLRNEY